MKTVSYTTTILEDSDTIVLISEWQTDEGHWTSNIPIQLREIQASRFDLIGTQLRGLEDRIRRRHGGDDVDVTRTRVTLPAGWSSLRGPDWLIGKRTRSVRQPDQQEKESEVVHEPV